MITFKSAILDLQQKLIIKTAENYKQFCSIYMQLSRLQSLETKLLLKPISLNNIYNQPHYELRNGQWITVITWKYYIIVICKYDS